MKVCIRGKAYRKLGKSFLIEVMKYELLLMGINYHSNALQHFGTVDAQLRLHFLKLVVDKILLDMSFEIYLAPVVLVQTALGAAIIYQIIDYLKLKPIGEQTLLDGLYIQLMEYWMLESIFVAIGIECFEDKISHWILAWIVGFGWYLVTILNSIHLIVCLTIQIVLIWYQDKIEGYEDSKVLNIIR